MELVRRIHLMQEVSRQARAKGRRIGFVPTLGALHEGHASLVRRVKELADIVVVSIYVNPLQFAPGEDFERYPRDLARDVDLCIAEEVDYVFAPSLEEMDPEGSRTFVEVDGLCSILEGASRPGHFRGVTTVVLKLFQIVQPTIAAFGQKDAQQLAIVRRMVRDLMQDVEILALPTVRDADGLALSSRNAHLSAEERQAARAIPRALEAARRAVLEGRPAEQVIVAVRELLEAEPGLAVDYVALVDRETFEAPVRTGGTGLLLVAARVGQVRLLDNAELEL